MLGLVTQVDTCDTQYLHGYKEEIGVKQMETFRHILINQSWVVHHTWVRQATQQFWAMQEMEAIKHRGGNT